MTFTQAERLDSTTIGKDFIYLEVVEAQNNKGQTVKYQYSIFINGMRTFSFCLPELEEFDLIELLKRFKWLA
jgi:hypothetical protein